MAVSAVNPCRALAHEVGVDVLLPGLEGYGVDIVLIIVGRGLPVPIVRNIL